MQIDDDMASVEPDQNRQHRKQLAQILRYIANMHHSLGNETGLQNRSPSFLRKTSSTRRQNEYWRSFYFQDFLSRGDEQQSFEVIFSTWSFRQLLAMEADSATPLFAAPPFSFYAAASVRSRPSPSARKRGWSAAFRNPLASRSDDNNGFASNNEGKACWLRLTRLTPSDIPERPSISNPAIRRYLHQWREVNSEEFTDCGPNPCDIITLETIGRAPKISPADLAHAQTIKEFLRSFKTYLLKRAYQKQLEPLYNQLFEWVQTENVHNEELVWGLGHARMCIPNEDGKTTVINGPLIEILLEVELSRDGALIIRPREHTGCSLNARVVAGLASSNSDDTSSSASSQHQRLTKLHRTVAELEPLQFAPGQPSTYIPLLKRIAVELSSGGTYQPSSSPKHTQHALPHYQMLVTEAWVVYARSKPTTVWARDALAFADQLLQKEEQVDIPRAALALTHGPGVFDDAAEPDDETVVSSASILDMFWKKKEEPVVEETPKPEPIVFPLPTSDSQDRIAELLLCNELPAVVCEGPPGTGKTHVIANMISSYLCQGKRVLITSKGSSALSVLRSRLPACIQDLVVDVSASELTGMRQLQQTVERLANRVSCASAELETEKSEILLRNIKALDDERDEIDRKLGDHTNHKRKMIRTGDSQRLAELAFDLIETVPWLARTTISWGIDDVSRMRNKLSAILDAQKLCEFERVSTAGCLTTDAVISYVASKAGQRLSMIKQASRDLIAAVPLVGSLVASGSHVLQEEVSVASVDGNTPDDRNDWKLVLDILQHQKNLEKLNREVLEPLMQQQKWPMDYIFENVGNLQQHRILRASFLEKFDQLLEVKQLAEKLDMSQEMKAAAECIDLDARRSLIAVRMQNLAADLVDAKVIMNLSQSFSAEAQSALIRFSQISAKAKFSRSSQPSKMTTRQRRHRQEYLEAFDRCVRYIPCWILTNSQISDYLPAEMLFDLVVIDEASQSDVTALPGLLRGRQWLIVGDGKQVSPTESFISEESIDSLRAALPKSPMEDSLLPGQSFFDLSAQAYPKFRVVLSEHFRCAPEIIMYSNKECYNGQLIPLRLPTAMERISPSLVNVRVEGRKVGKVNETECDEIVKLIRNFVTAAAVNPLATPRSIGVISLVGSDQASLIRGRLLDSIGPQKMKEHDVLIGDPPAFQGAERDIVFLSMVCSPGQVVSQTKQMHAQRFNVALSRARDQMVLVRSIDVSHIPNGEDLKLAAIEFFEDASAVEKEDGDSEKRIAERQEANTHGFQARAENLLEQLLQARGYAVRSMGVVWKDALCIEHFGSNERAALKVENSGESEQEWQRSVTQQRSIERVGWKCMRLDGFSLLMDHIETFEKVVSFLAQAGVKEPEVTFSSSDQDGEAEDDVDEDEDTSDQKKKEEADLNNDRAGESVVVISSDDENGNKRARPTPPVPDQAPSDLWGLSRNDDIDASRFGEVVKLDFLRGGNEAFDGHSGDEESDQEDSDQEDGHRSVSSAPVSRSKQSRSLESESKRRQVVKGVVTGESHGDQSIDDEETGDVAKKEKETKNRRLDSYSRDGRWYPDRVRDRQDDTDSEMDDHLDQGGSPDDE